MEKVRFEWGDCWVWCAFDPHTKLLLAMVVGPRILPQAVKLLQEVKAVSDGALPLFTSDEWPGYPEALLQVFGVYETPPRTGKPGRPKGPRVVPPPELDYAQVVKTKEKGRVVKVERTVIFGDPKRIARRLADSSVSHQVNTSFVERHNGTMRQSCRRLTRKTNGFSKDHPPLEAHLEVCRAYYHLVRPHGGLRVKTGDGKHQERTPAMVAEVTDHGWSVEELLGVVIPPEYLQ